MEKKPTLGDKAILWGTVLSFILVGVGFTAWLTHIDYRVTSVAEAQDQDRAAQEKKSDDANKKLDELLMRVSRIEGALGTDK